MTDAAALPIEYVDRGTLTPHPDNYRNHPEDQLAHIIESIRTNGVYRPLVVSKDNVILAGHGLFEALTELGVQDVPITRVPFDHTDPAALALLVGDNEIANLVDDSDAKLIDLLLTISHEDDALLLGTGYNQQQLAALQALTAPPKSGWDPLAEWEASGQEPYEPGAPAQWRLNIKFKSDGERQTFIDDLGDKLADLHRLKESQWVAAWGAE